MGRLMSRELSLFIMLSVLYISAFTASIIVCWQTVMVYLLSIANWHYTIVSLKAGWIWEKHRIWHVNFSSVQKILFWQNLKNCVPKNMLTYELFNPAPLLPGRQCFPRSAVQESLLRYAVESIWSLQQSRFITRNNNGPLKNTTRFEIIIIPSNILKPVSLTLIGSFYCNI